MEIKLQVGVKAIIKNSEGKYLLLERNSEKYPEVDDPWDIPGGRIDPGASLFDNLAREIKEETSLRLTDKPKIIAAQDILRVEGRHVIRLTYLAKAEGEVHVDGNEHNKHKWFSLEELKELNGLDNYLQEVINAKESALERF